VKAEKTYPNMLVPIFWGVQLSGGMNIEYMPYQHSLEKEYSSDDVSFLTSYTWPTNSKTGKRLNWLKLPVIDRHLDEDSTYRGFLQDATGWKPSVLQPLVSIQVLRSVLAKYHR